MPWGGWRWRGGKGSRGGVWEEVAALLLATLTRPIEVCTPHVENMAIKWPRIRTQPLNGHTMLLIFFLKNIALKINCHASRGKIDIYKFLNKTYPLAIEIYLWHIFLKKDLVTALPWL